MITLDIESEAIVDFAPLLPKPVGVAIRWEDGRSEYLAFGHPFENNTDWDTVHGILTSIWGKEILTHNGATFDIPVLQHHFCLPPRDPLLTHDTLFLAYLHDPHANSLSLKDLANVWLGWPPEEQEELQRWILANTECKTKSKAGAFIARAPGNLVGKYAIGDVDRTFALYEYLVEAGVRSSMGEAYERELRLAPILSNIQNTGVRVDVARLQADTEKAMDVLHLLDAQIRQKLNAPELSIDSNDSLVGALQASGYTNFLTTPTGKLSAGKASIDKALEDDPELAEMLHKRATYATLTSTFMRPYLEITEANGGRLHAAYNQVRNPDGYGTRTGRLSSSRPNFQNLPGDLGHQYPLIRSYILPEPGQVWVTGDFKNQEPRLAAHFEDGALCAAFNENPNLDPYLFTAEASGGITRKQAKVVFLGLLYAMGAKALAGGLGETEQMALIIKNCIKAAFPGLVALDNDCKARFRRGLPIRTLGGRYYHCEPPKNGRSYEYKALNILIQGSASDQTKEAIIYIAERLLPWERILGTVHDEVSVSCTIDRVEDIKRIMTEAANKLPCDVPMLMDFGQGNNWAEAK